ncbi:hypothetical protein [Streptomyces sp. NPDC059409]|uniref:hypothetical protein n=1 Tax=Streptomyces sp. NPDC059409 TaxID=3346824 RepID=UPI0036D0C7D3
MSHSTQPGRRGALCYRVRTETFEATFLPNPGEYVEYFQPGKVDRVLECHRAPAAAPSTSGGQ